MVGTIRVLVRFDTLDIDFVNERIYIDLLATVHRRRQTKTDIHGLPANKRMVSWTKIWLFKRLRATLKIIAFKIIHFRFSDTTRNYRDSLLIHSLNY